MKHLFTLMLFASIVLSSHAAFVMPVSHTHPTDSAIATSPLTQADIMRRFVSLTPVQYGTFRGKKLNFFERISFRASQKRIARKLAEDHPQTTGFNIGGFLLGGFLGVLGVLGAYLFSHDRNLRKWAWIGWGVWIVIALLFII
jgi:hypothetical protein